MLALLGSLRQGFYRSGLLLWTGLAGWPFGCGDYPEKCTLELQLHAPLLSFLFALLVRLGPGSTYLFYVELEVVQLFNCQVAGVQSGSSGSTRGPPRGSWLYSPAPSKKVRNSRPEGMLICSLQGVGQEFRWALGSNASHKLILTPQKPRAEKQDLECKSSWSSWRRSRFLHGRFY